MSMPTYRAVVCEALGPPDSLRLRRLPTQPLGPGTVRVALRAAGINFPDVLMIQGLYQHRPELPFVPGLEAAGVVAEVAPDVSGVARRRQGDRAHAHRRPTPRKPSCRRARSCRCRTGFSFADGATFLVAHISAYHALEDARRRSRRERRCWCWARRAASASRRVQLGKALGARVLAAASSAEKLAGRRAARRRWRRSTTRKERVEDGVKRLTSGKGVDVVLDPVGIAQESRAAMPRARRQAADRRASRAAPSPPTPPTASCSRARP